MFENQLAIFLPETYALLISSNLVIHEKVTQIFLHGSRGLAGGYRPDSDIDLSLIIDTVHLSARKDIEALLQDVLKLTLNNWMGKVELDLAGVFDVRNCGLKCFDQIVFDEQQCPQGGTDCFGVYKVQKGFSGFVDNAGVRTKLMHPCLNIWRCPPEQPPVFPPAPPNFSR